MTEFNEILGQFYATHGRRTLPWRQPDSQGNFDPYKILVSEIMLQQTQVGRVIPKYHEFLMKFPDVPSLASAPLAAVLTSWSGLGYNRRAKFLWQAAQLIHAEYADVFPATSEDLATLPGVGKNTAGALLAYAFNKPVVFIETNIRTVYIHHFFQDQLEDVADAAIVALVQRTLDHEQSREFYWALMDYGSHLKQTVGNLNRRSTSYAKQSKFEGSKRQIRGQVLRVLANGNATLGEMAQQIVDKRLTLVVQDLVHEKLIIQTGDNFHL